MAVMGEQIDLVSLQSGQVKQHIQHKHMGGGANVLKGTSTLIVLEEEPEEEVVVLQEDEKEEEEVLQVTRPPTTCPQVPGEQELEVGEHFLAALGQVAAPP